ncbi:MAG: hypothetical protein ABI359_02590 [Ginsengibacter sp.]
MQAKIALVHCSQYHQDNKPPDSGDLYGFIKLASESNLYQTRYLVTESGAVYALVVTDMQAVIKFNTDYPSQTMIGDNEPDFPESLANEINEMTQIEGATPEMALAFILNEKNAGIALLKQTINGNFKRLNTTENIDNNGNKYYTASNCQ